MDWKRRRLIILLMLPLALVQLMYGTSLALIFVMLLTWSVCCAPFIVQGLNLYTLLAISIGLRYVGAAAVIKTFMAQPLELNLLEPLGAYVLSFAIVSLLTIVILIAQALDRKHGLLKCPTDPGYLHRLGTYGFVFGGIAAIIAGIFSSHRVGLTTPGPIFIIASGLSNLFVMGIAAEGAANIIESNRKRILSPSLIVMVGLAVALALFLNVRGFVFYALIALVITAVIYRALTWRHLALGVVFMAIFALYVSPLIIVLRYKKEGTSPAEFAALCVDTIVKSVTDPDYATEAIQRQHVQDIEREGITPSDYYGTANEMLNRFSFVGIADRAVNATHYYQPIGMENYSESFSRILPTFLKRDKSHPFYQHPDWLAWRLGIEPGGSAWAINYPEPIEGFSSLGVIGLFISPFIFGLTCLYAASWVTSMRVVSPISIGLLPILHLMLMEGSSDVYVTTVTRTLPLIFVAVYVLMKISALPLWGGIFDGAKGQVPLLLARRRATAAAATSQS